MHARSFTDTAFDAGPQIARRLDRYRHLGQRVQALFPKDDGAAQLGVAGERRLDLARGLGLEHAEHVLAGQDLQQSAFNFISNTAGGASGNLNNSIRSQGITFGNVSGPLAGRALERAGA